MIRLVIADDHPVVRAGLRALLDGAVDIDVVGEAATPDEAVALAASLDPDLVLMDLQFGQDRTGADATRQIRSTDAAPYVLVLTNYDSDGDILGAVEAGASGYLLKDTPPDELLAAVRAAAAGESALAPAVASRLMARMRAPRVSLSAREIEVLRLVADGRLERRRGSTPAHHRRHREVAPGARVLQARRRIPDRRGVRGPGARHPPLTELPELTTRGHQGPAPIRDRSGCPGQWSHRSAPDHRRRPRPRRPRPGTPRCRRRRAP